MRYFDGTNWEDIKEKTIGFKAHLSSDIINWDEFEEEKIDGLIEEFDEQNNFNPITGEFTAPSNGIYQLRLRLNLNANINVKDRFFYARTYVNGSVINQNGMITNFIITNFVALNTTLDYHSTRKLLAGDKVQIRVANATDTTITIKAAGAITGTNISGYKIK